VPIQWPCGLRRESTAARLLVSWVRIADPVAVRSKVWVFGRSLARIVGSNCRSQWPCGLRRGSSAARLLGSWVRIADPVAVRSKA
jgi:hypothetical protein